MIFYIDIENASGTKIGDGPISTAKEWTNTDKLDLAGTFSFTMSLTDEKVKYLQPKNRVKCYTLINNSRSILGYGIIDKTEININDDGTKELTVSGDNIARELTYRSVGFLQLADSAGNGVSNAIQTVMAFAPSGWTRSGETTDAVYASFDGDSVLSALTKIAESNGEHFRILPTKKIVWFANETTPIIRAERVINNVSDSSNTDICFIKNITKTSDSYDLITRLYPYGSGNGSERLDLYWSNISSISGYTINKTNNYIQNNTTYGTYGLIERYLSWKDISPISNSDNDLTSASNTLLYTAWEYLKKYSQANSTYDLEVFKVDKIIYPGQLIKVVYRDIVDGYTIIDINQNMYILEVTNKIDSSGVKTTDLKVSTIDAWPSDDVSAIVSSMETATVLEAHPQMNVCYYSENFGQFNIDPTNNASMTFKFDNEIVKLNNAKLRFKSDVFESTAKTIAQTGSYSINVNTSEDGGTNISGESYQTISEPYTSSTPSSQGGSVSGDDEYDGVHGHAVPVTGTDDVSDYKLVYYDFGDFYVDGTGGKVWTNDLTNHRHSTPNHVHTMPAHQHKIPNHKHTVQASINTTPTLSLDYGIYRDTLYPTNVSVYLDNTLVGTYTSIQSEVEVEVSSIINSNLRSTHTIRFECTGGRGRILPSLRCFVTVQSVILTS